MAKGKQRAEGNVIDVHVLHIILPHALDDSPIFLGEMDISVDVENFYSNYESYPK